MKTIEIKGVIGMPENYTTEKEIKEFRGNQIKNIVDSKETVLNVEIDSLGGDVNHAIAVRNALAKHPAKIQIEYVGWSASAATIIATAGTVKAAENIMILPHEARGGVKGVKSDIQSYVDWLDKTNGIIAGMYAEKTGQDKETMLTLMSKNNGEGEWLTAMEAKELGLIDEVYEPMAAAAFVDLGELPGIPENKLNQINQINMNIFKRKEKDEPINSIQLGETLVIFEGELAKNTKLMPTNADVLENGEYILGDKTIVVKDMEVEEIVEEEPAAALEEKEEELKAAMEETVKKDEEIQNLLKEQKALQAKVNAQEKEFETLKNQLGEIKSTHKTEVKTEVTEVKNELPLNIQIKKEVQELINKKGDK